MRLFKINKEITIGCEASKTRNGFKHEAILLLNDYEFDRVKVNYLNRTWEAYEYDTVIQKLLDKTTVLDDKQKKLVIKKLKERRS